jgi:hypothetical protein
VLDKPFKDVCKHLSLGKKVTPKAMRRTPQDLARRAEDWWEKVGAREASEVPNLQPAASA